MEKNSGYYIMQTAFALAGAALGIYLIHNGLLGPVGEKGKNAATIIGAVAGGYIGKFIADCVA